MPASPQVSRMFREYLNSWEKELVRRRQTCAAAAQERRSLHDTGTPAALRLDQVLRQCQREQSEMERVIGRLRLAALTGEWSASAMVTSVKKEARRISGRVDRISRGARYLVLGVRGDWWNVRTRSGHYGWVCRHDAQPTLPGPLGLVPR